MQQRSEQQSSVMFQSGLKIRRTETSTWKLSYREPNAGVQYAAPRVANSNRTVALKSLPNILNVHTYIHTYIHSCG
jgi:hypothetical protein